MKNWKEYSDDNCKIVYEQNSEGIYIQSIKSETPKSGHGTKLLEIFIKQFENVNIYLYPTRELGTDEKILKKWYKKCGFIEMNLYYFDNCYKATMLHKKKNPTIK